MIQALLTALKAKFDATPALTSAFTGGWHLEEAPESAAYPYLVIQVMTAPVDSKYGGVRQGDVSIMFSAVSTPEQTDAGTLAELACQTFDEFVPTLSGGPACFNMIRRDAPTPRLIGRDSAGRDVYEAQWVNEYAVRP